MPTERMVTRTFKITTAEVKVLDKESTEEIVMSINLTKTFKSDKALEKACKDEIEKKGNYKFLYVISYSITTELKGMNVADFYEMSTELPNRTKQE